MDLGKRIGRNAKVSTGINNLPLDEIERLLIFYWQFQWFFKLSMIMCCCHKHKISCFGFFLSLKHALCIRSGSGDVGSVLCPSLPWQAWKGPGPSLGLICFISDMSPLGQTMVPRFGHPGERPGELPKLLMPAPHLQSLSPLAVAWTWESCQDPQVTQCADKFGNPWIWWFLRLSVSCCNDLWVYDSPLLPGAIPDYQFYF